MQRKLPLVTSETAPFWQGGASGRLQICYCNGCLRFFHPPAGLCPGCGSAAVGPRAVSGRGSVFSFTINRQAWVPQLAEPYVVAIVELAEQPGLRFLTNVVDCPPEQVRIGLPVRVRFEQVEELWIPLFTPDTGDQGVAA